MMLKKIVFLLCVYFCWAGFSEPVFLNPTPSNPVFSPIPLFLNPKQTSFVFPEQTPLTPLCPQSVPVDLCLSLTSMPFLQMDANQNTFPTMFTPFFIPSEEISSNRLEKIFNEEDWITYDYSKEDYSFKRRSKRKEKKKSERKTEEKTEEAKKADTVEKKESETDKEDKQPSTDDSLSIHYRQEDPSQVIREETKNGHKIIQKGTVKAVPTEQVKTQKNKQRETEITVETPTPSIDVILQETEKKIDCTTLNDSSTEAEAVCVKCSEASSQTSKKKLINKLKQTICYPGFIENIRNNFNNTCHPLNFNEFVKKFLICESCKEKVPPVLMLSMLTVESSGKCEAENTSHREQSVGLFQINTNFHTPRKCSSAEKNSIKKFNFEELKEEKPKCMHHPIINTRKGIEVLKDQYRLTNNKQKANFQCTNKKETHQNKDAWRKAVAGYNGGQGRIKRKLRLIQTKPKNIPQTVWDRMSEWQKIRTYYFHCEGQCSDENFDNDISNLAHAEAIFGSVDPSRYPTIFQKWQDTFPDLNDNSHCQ